MNKILIIDPGYIYLSIIGIATLGFYVSYFLFHRNQKNNDFFDDDDYWGGNDGF